MLSMRIDVENLLQHETVPDPMLAIYETDVKALVAVSDSSGELEIRKAEGGSITVPRARINNWKLRVMICYGIIELALPPDLESVPIRDIDLKLQTLLGELDIPYGAMLISPDTDIEFEISKRPRMTNLFVNPIVPDGIIYGLADPEFLGVVPHRINGDAGMLITNAKGIASIVVSPMVQAKVGRKEMIENWMVLSDVMES
jgi:hypothetical protein